jgi:hypothetical protein
MVRVIHGLPKLLEVVSRNESWMKGQLAHAGKHAESIGSNLNEASATVRTRETYPVQP